MKKCEEVLELLSLYIDDELDDVTAKAVEEHVKLCSSCKKELELLREVVKMCNGLDEVELPENFNESLHQKLISEQKEMEENRKIRLMEYRKMKLTASIAAIFILVFAAGGLFYRFGNLSQMFGISGRKEAMYYKEVDEQNRVAALKREDENKLTASYDKSENIESDNTDDISVSATGDTFALNTDPDNNNFSISSVPTETDVPGIATNDGGTFIAFNEDVNVYGGNYSISITAYSDNFNSDVSTINDIAEKYGTKIEEVANNDSKAITAKGGSVGAIMGFTATNRADYIVSYSMDKSSYDDFIKEIRDKYKGKYYISNNEEALNNRLTEINQIMSEFEKRKTTDTDEYKSLVEERENILNQLNILETSDEIIIDIGIVNNE